MLSIDRSGLNAFEKSICEQIEQAAGDAELTITRAAALCGCSVSKISKLTRRLGFANYKQFIAFVSGKEIIPKTPSPELGRKKTKKRKEGEKR